MSFRNIIRNNVISGNWEHGINIDGVYQSRDNDGKVIWKSKALMTLIEKNSIGTTQFVSDTIPNYANGIVISSSKLDVIQNNYISGNKWSGIYIANASSEMITIRNNFIGTDRTTKKALPNGTGIMANGIGHIIQDNIISGNLYTGLSLSAPESEVTGNIIGLDSAQTVAVPNYHGISTTIWSSFLKIGGNEGYPNIIAGNMGDGIIIYGAGTQNISVSNNILGTNKNLDKQFPNNGSGFYMTHSLRNIDINKNIIAALDLYGIRMERNVVRFLDTTRPNLYQKPSNIYIYDNQFVGKFGASVISLFNVDSIYIYSNRIENSESHGISIENDSTRFVYIWDNEIGPEQNLLFPVNIQGHGINIENCKNIYIGLNDNETDIFPNKLRNIMRSGVYTRNADSIKIIGNTFSAIGSNAISITDSSQIYTILGNHIGPLLAADKEQIIEGDGILVDGSSKIILGNFENPDDNSNKIYNCKGYGLSLMNKADEVFYGINLMKGNLKGGISLDSLDLYYYSRAYDDDFDLDSGSNGLQNTPLILNQKIDGDKLTFNGSLKGKVNSNYKIDIYLSETYAGFDKYKVQGSIYWFFGSYNKYHRYCTN